MSLRNRLTLIISVLFLSGMLLGLAFLISNARQRVATEVRSSATLTWQLLNIVLSEDDLVQDSEQQLQVLQNIASLEDVRHMEISIRDNDKTEYLLLPDTENTAPDWFSKLVTDSPLVLQRELGNMSNSTITIRTNPANEIDEVWQETRSFLLILMLVLLMLNGILYVILGRWLSPVTRILHNLEALECNRPVTKIPSHALPELSVIAEKINDLSRVLQDSRDDNERLRTQSLNIQEAERRHLAQELHDEMGQSISAIKALAYSVAERNKDDALSLEGAQRITAISNTVRDQIRSMMQRLRPAVLDELGLLSAIENMVDEWNRIHVSTFCSLRSSGDFSCLSDEYQIHLYRIIQEALTNVAAHAAATAVEVTLKMHEHCNLTIKDNGKGFTPDNATRGMGLIGMQERAGALHADWNLQTAPGKGVAISLNFSCH